MSVLMSLQWSLLKSALDTWFLHFLLVNSFEKILKIFSIRRWRFFTFWNEMLSNSFCKLTILNGIYNLFLNLILIIKLLQLSSDWLHFRFSCMNSVSAIILQAYYLLFQLPELTFIFDLIFFNSFLFFSFVWEKLL